MPMPLFRTSPVRRSSCRGRRPLAVLAAGLGLSLTAAAAARADLVVLADGGVLKVKAYELADADHARLTLLSGGRLTLALTRVERVVDDEVAPEPEPAPGAPSAPGGGAAAGPGQVVALRFDPAQTVPEGPWGAMIYEAARRHALNPVVVAAVIRAESAGNPFAVSRVGARGLMQLMPATAERFGVRHQELFDPAQNLEAGSRYLSWLIDQFPQDLAKVLAAYNAGENAVTRYGGVPPYRETRGYVRRIFASLGLALVPGWTGQPAGGAGGAGVRVATAGGRSR
jgi:soluble lytic murein transglycosylase-like protein